MNSPDPIIQTERLLLRRMRPDDAEALHAIFRDPETMLYWSTLPHGSLSQTFEFVTRTIAACDAGEADDFAVVFEGRVIGKAGVWQGDEIGYIIARETWGKGLAKEAVRAVIARAFAQGRTRIHADVDPRNARSIALLKKLGFRETGSAKRTYQIGDVWTDSIYLELLNSN
jgi:[ribosomal protein S5]-alanine N-acetyltransferase